MSLNPESYGDVEDDFDIPADVENGEPPEGDYSVYLVDLQKSTSKKKEDGSGGNPMIVWTFKGEKGSGLPEGKTFVLYTALTPKALFKAHQTAVGLGLRKPEDMGDLKFKKKDALGRRGMGTFKKETFNGRESLKLQTVVAHPAGFGPVELTPDDLPF